MAGTIAGQPPRKRLKVDDDPFDIFGEDEVPRIVPAQNGLGDLPLGLHPAHAPPRDVSPLQVFLGEWLADP